MVGRIESGPELKTGPPAFFCPLHARSRSLDYRLLKFGLCCVVASSWQNVRVLSRGTVTSLLQGAGSSHVEGLRPRMITKERKAQLITHYLRDDSDTGAPEVQVAILTTRSNRLTEHMQSHKKYYASRRGLLAMVSRRRRLLDYLKRVNPNRYLDIIRRLELRK